MTRRIGSSVTAADLTGFLHERLARFKVPRAIAFDELPKTSTGKIQKGALRERAPALLEQEGGAG